MNYIDLPKTLYHYTTQEGLLGIIKDEALWATQIRYMNDASELTTPIKIACDALTEFVIKKFDPSKISFKFVSGQEKSPQEIEIAHIMNEFLKKLSEANIFVISFSQSGDSLSQWRAYGNPGSAYSIGFNSKKLSEAAAKVGFELLECHYYNEGEQKEKIRDAINEFVGQILQNPPTWRAAFVYDAALKFLKLASTMKHHSFKEEKEWRLVWSQSSSKKIEADSFRAGKSMIIPYYALQLKPLPITHIYIGPCPHQELSKKAVEEFLAKELLPRRSVPVKISQTPYRNW